MTRTRTARRFSSCSRQIEEREPERFSRVIRLFDGADEGEPQALARAEWKRAKAEGFEVSYWRQDPGGAWKKSA